MKNPLDLKRARAKAKARVKVKEKGKGKRDDTPSRDDKTKFDPKGPNVVPSAWKDKEYDDTPIVQDAKPADHYVEAYLQGATDDSYLPGCVDHINGNHGKAKTHLPK